MSEGLSAVSAGVADADLDAADRTESLRNDLLAWLEAPRSSKVSEHVAKRILADIVERDLAPGTMLQSEPTMMRHYRVSRSSLREAIRILEVYGLVRVRAGSRGGPVIVGVSSRDLGRSVSLYLQAAKATLADLQDASLEMEPLMARMAAVRVAESQRSNDPAASVAAESAARLADQTNPRFHVAVCALSGNSVMSLMCASLLNLHAQRTYKQFGIIEGRDVEIEHGRVTEAIMGGDADAAERFMRQHIESQLAVVNEVRPELLTELIDWR